VLQLSAQSKRRNLPIYQEKIQMDQPHLSSQLDYFEQKIQESLAATAKLQQKIETQEYVIQEQNRRIQQLEAELTQANTQLDEAAKVDGKLSHLRDEMVQYFERRYTRPEPALGQSSGLATQQLENQARALNDLRREVAKTDRFDEQVALARTETGRLNQEVSKFQAQIDSLNRKLEERTSPIKLYEEQRRADMRKLTELRAELPELQKKIEATRTRVDLVGQQVPQFAKYEVALDGIREDIRGYREHMDFQLAQRERQIKDWTALAEVTERRIREIETQMEKYTEFYQLNKRALTSLQDFQERLQRDQHRFGELQRLAEDRQRAEIEKFRADFEQRWQKQSMEMQPLFADFQRSKDASQKRIDELAKLHTKLEDELSVVLQIIEEDVQARAIAVAEWQRRFEQIAEEGQS
jgi:DNA repair exonuclease SbcCD ATPase subunit